MKILKHLGFYILLMAIVGQFQANAQDDLDALLDQEMSGQTEEVAYTFKATRIVSAHSVERMQAGHLDLRISHRFSKLTDDVSTMFGLDHSNIFYSLEYGATDWLMLGLGRETNQKTFIGFVKLSLMRQEKGPGAFPLTLSWVSDMYINSADWEHKTYLDFGHRLAYCHQLLIARKLTERLSLQLTPSYLHQNLVAMKEDENSHFALGIGGRFKITNWVSVNAEYFYVSGLSDGNYMPVSLGFDIDTGGHVFQLIFSNSNNMTGLSYLTGTRGDLSEKDIYFGFNISRVFDL